MELSVLHSLFGEKAITRFLKNNRKYKLKDGWVGSRLSLERIAQKKISEQKIDIARDLAGYFHLIPWVRFVAISGSTSFGTATQGSDIDIFMVVAKNRLWITRAFDEILFNLLGVRKVLWRPGNKNKLCINFYTSEEKLNLDIKKKHRFLTALEIVMLKPVFNDEYYEILLSRNMWIKKFFPKLKIKKARQKKANRIPVISFLFDVLDYLAMYMQIGFMKLMGHSTENSTLTRNRITFFDQNIKWERRQDII